ncbi:hypothetical protein CNMCM5623_007811 [Aspergillus felis]|uniref:Vacuolar calcium ion transporter n=1 Tax=Aspergillus felis TaxID=1287682 RepID=A0A8H6UR12_9EURO|nr:hypothetical protein CNMCM5623_007811 [Aspergillus felis]
MLAGIKPTQSNKLHAFVSYLVKTLTRILKAVRGYILASWINLLLPCVPAGFAVKYGGCSAPVIFAVNFLAILPASELLGLALKQIQRRLNTSLWALLYSSFGNAVQLITSILLLRSRQIRTLQMSLIGGILSNMHLMLGLSFLVGGIRYSEACFNTFVAAEMGALLLLAITGIILPTATELLAKPKDGGVLRQSRALSVVFLVVYCCFLYFQFRSHSELFAPPDYDLPDEAGNSQDPERGEAEGEPEQEEESIMFPLTVMALSATLIGFHGLFATDTLEALMRQTGMTETFVGIFLLPLLTNDSEPVKAAARGEMDICLLSTVGKCVQTTFLIIPVIVILGWIMQVDNMTLSFDGFEIATLFASVIYINVLISNGKSNWLEGIALIAMFMAISIAAYYIE